MKIDNIFAFQQALARTIHENSEILAKIFSDLLCQPIFESTTDQGCQMFYRGKVQMFSQIGPNLQFFWP